MAELTFKIDDDGQAVNQSELNTLGQVAGLADERVFAELLRMTPDTGTPARGILPYGTGATVAPNGASGSVIVNPFRAFIGSRTVVGTDALANWRDSRSALSVAAGATALTTVVSLAANSSGNSRWDAVYAAVAVDSAVSPVTRKVKNPSSGVVTEESVTLFAQTVMTLGVVTGTPGASPAFPSLPGDSGSTFYVLLCYVRVPTGFGPSTTVSTKDFFEAATVLGVSSAMGLGTLRPANQSSIVGGVAITGTGTSPTVTTPPQKWTGTALSRPACYMPPSMQGSDSILIAIDLSDASSANWSHASGAIVDNSRDWSRRLFKWVASVSLATGGAGAFPWYYTRGSPDQDHLFSGEPNTPGYSASTSFPAFVPGVGNSFDPDVTAVGLGHVAKLASSGSAGVATPAAGFNVCTNAMITGTTVTLYVSSGALKVNVSGAPLCTILLWLDATAQFPNG